MLYTSSMKYCGMLQSLDITVKCQHPYGKDFAPTWAMVKDYHKHLNESKYTALYMDILNNNPVKCADFARIAIKHDVVIKCYCRAGTFCHRIILAKYLVGFGVVYAGEV